MCKWKCKKNNINCLRNLILVIIQIGFTTVMAAVQKHT